MKYRTILVLFIWLFSHSLLFAQWQLHSTGTTNTLWDVYFSSSKTGCAVGNYGMVLKTYDAGATWYQMDAPSSYKIYAMDFVDDLTGIAVGEYKNIIKTTNGGETWSTKAPTSSDWLFGVHFPVIDTGYAVGYKGSVWKSDNAGNFGWVEIKTGDSLTTYKSVHFITGFRGFIAGDNGTIIKTTDGGENWTKMTTPTDNNLRKIYFKNNLLGFAIGDS
ncbi:hypothetical protein JYU23_01780, partial [bacterium AH-315-C07]|nr:hypothetical protein [bacterium AH-315-C07]